MSLCWWQNSQVPGGNRAGLFPVQADLLLVLVNTMIRIKGFHCVYFLRCVFIHWDVYTQTEVHTRFHCRINPFTRAAEIGQVVWSSYILWRIRMIHGEQHFMWETFQFSSPCSGDVMAPSQNEDLWAWLGSESRCFPDLRGCRSSSGTLSLKEKRWGRRAWSAWEPRGCCHH